MVAIENTMRSTLCVTGVYLEDITNTFLPAFHMNVSSARLLYLFICLIVCVLANRFAFVTFIR